MPFSGGISDHQHTGSGDGGSVIQPATISSANLNISSPLSSMPSMHPTGSYICSSTTLPPSSGWKKCDGSAISQTTFAALFAVIGLSFGNPGGGNFSLPDMRGRAPIGVGAGSGLTARALGASLGEENHPITQAEMAAHTHTVQVTVPSLSPGAVGAVANVAPNANAASNATITSNVGTTSNIGSGTAHNTMQPSLAIGEWYIKT